MNLSPVNTNVTHNLTPNITPNTTVSQGDGRLDGKVTLLPNNHASHKNAINSIANAKVEASQQEEVTPLKSKMISFLKDVGAATYAFMESALKITVEVLTFPFELLDGL